MSETNKPTNDAVNDDDSENRGKGVPFMSRRNALKLGGTLVGAGAVIGGGLWYGTQPSVAATVQSSGADNVVLGGSSSDVVSVTDVTIAPEVDVAFNGFSKGVDEADIKIVATVTGNQSDSNYSGSQDTWTLPDDGDDTEQVTISDTVPTTGSKETYTYSTDSSTASVSVQTPDLTDQTSRSLGDSNENNILIGFDTVTDPSNDADDPLPFDTAIEQSSNIASGVGHEMFPQDIDADHYGLTVVDLDYTITLKHSDGDSDSISSGSAGGKLAHTFDVAVENLGGTVSDADVDSNTGGSGNDGV